MTSFARFQSTMWTLVHSARSVDPRAFDAFVSRYRPPVVRYLRGRGHAEQEAEDLAQEVFLRIFQKDLLKDVDESKGRFRSYLIGIANNVAREHSRRDRAAKRGGGAVRSLDAQAREVAAPDEAAFTREWMLNLVRLALDRLGGQGEAARRNLDMFRRSLRDRPSYVELAGAYGVPESTVRSGLYETRRKLRQEVAALINEYAVSEKDFREELKAFDAFGGDPPSGPCSR